MNVDAKDAKGRKVRKDSKIQISAILSMAVDFLCVLCAPLRPLRPEIQTAFLRRRRFRERTRIWRGCFAALALAVCASSALAGDALIDRLEQAGADSGHAWVRCSDATPVTPPVEAALQYLPGVGELLAWRVFVQAAGRCVRVDWPRAHALSARQAHGLQVLLAQQQAAGRFVHDQPLAGADVAPLALRAQPQGWHPAPVVDPGSDRPSLPWCPRTPERRLQVPVDLPEQVSPLLVRVRPHRCVAGSRPASGSGVLLSPDLAVTAAHVILTDAGQVCDRYRIIPGGRRYTDPPAAPFGLAFASRAFLSERGGWNLGASGAPAPNDDFGARTAHDHAWLRLDRSIALPIDTHWPRLRFVGDQRRVPGPRVLRAGYAAIGPVGRIAPGAAVNTFGQIACPRSRDEPHWRFSLWMGPGASGGPIWSWPGSGQAFELLSLAVRMETHGEHQYETLGPRFDETDYWRLLDVLGQR